MEESSYLVLGASQPENCNTPPEPIPAVGGAWGGALGGSVVVQWCTEFIDHLPRLSSLLTLSGGNYYKQSCNYPRPRGNYDPLPEVQERL
jgi:hypothetical protein